MLPTLSSGKIVVGVRATVYTKGDIVIVLHHGIEKIKRVAAVRGDQIFVLGDNPEKSTDSRSFGWLSVTLVRAKIIWPLQRGAGKSKHRPSH